MGCMMRRCLSLLAIPLIACSDDAPRTASPLVHDSAGVRIVENRNSMSPTLSWTIEPDLRIGVESGNELLELGEIGDIAVADDGTILVLDWGASVVRSFDHDGNPLSVTGGSGSGPGEFSTLVRRIVLGPDETYWVPDRSNVRVSRFSLDGEFLTSFRLDLVEGEPLEWASTRSGNLLVRRRISSNGWDGLLSLQTTGTVADTVLVFEYEDGQPTPEHLKNVLLSAVPVWNALPNGHIVYGISTEYKLYVLDPTGALTAVYSRAIPPTPISEDERAAFWVRLREIFETSEEGIPPAVIDQALQQIELVDVLPFFARIEPGPEATIWVQRVPTPDQINPRDLNVSSSERWGGRTWDVFDRQGHFMGATELPTGFELKTIWNNEIYGVGETAGGAQQVVRLRVGRE